MTDENQTVEAGPLSTLPASKGINIAGQKGVSLGAEQSSAIRDRLMQMIAEREGYQGSWKHIGDLGALAAAPIGGYSAAYDQYAARNRQREKDLLELQMGVGQLDTEQARLKQKAAQDAAFFQNLGFQVPGQQPKAQPQGGGLPAAGGAPEAPQGGALPAAGAAPQGGALPTPAAKPAGDQLSQAEKAAFYQLYQHNPAKANELLLGRIKPTDLQRELAAAGVNPALANQLIIAIRSGELFKETPVTQMEGPNAGYQMPSTSFDIVGQRLGLGGVGLRGAQTPPAAPAQQAAKPSVPAAPTQQAAAPSAAVVNPTATPNIGAGEGAGAINVPNPHPVGSPEYRKFREDAAKKEIEVQGSAATKVGEGDAAEISAMSGVVSKAPDRMAELDKAVQNIDKYPQMFGRLMRPTATSVVMNALSQGVTVGRLGAVGFPGVNELSIQLDPTAKKDPGAIRAWNETVAVINQVLGDYTAVANKGQGSVSNQERQLYRDAVGDPAKMDAQSLRTRALATRLSYQHTLEVNDAWNAAQKAGQRNFQQFKASPAFQEMQKRHFYETAKTLGVKGAEWKQDMGNAEDEAAKLRAELRGKK